MATSTTFPQAEDALMRAAYGAAQVILEYGSGGSTLMAAGMPGKRVFSVESDRDWAAEVQRKIDASHPLSAVTVYHADIGPTGIWGRPKSAEYWQRFHRYPLAIWDEPFFRHPDLVLVDGRFRAACFAAAFMRISRPVTLLFDDYASRPNYHLVEQLARPRRLIGRMAEFCLTPQPLSAGMMTLIIRLFADVTYAHERYEPAPGGQGRGGGAPEKP